ncbi:hypothetical protein SNE40_018293 [Patella caerulea]|uniref:Uncharacterized protein n=1 Tax=Patella caerulea TaxID=87958 RepID=A0AAN8PAM0_PATCE
MLKTHRVAISERKFKNKSLFMATGQCTFADCSVKLKLKMTVIPQMVITYERSICHHITHPGSRPITKAERRELYKNFEHGANPNKVAGNTLVSKEADVLISGNLNDIGSNKNVLQKVASESNQTGRMDRDTFNSLLSLKTKFKSGCPVGIGFIQNIGFDPFFVYFWSENSIQLWNNIAKTGTVYFDATGNVCRKMSDGSTILYYEIALQHPLKGGTTIPIAGSLRQKPRQP